MKDGIRKTMDGIWEDVRKSRVAEEIKLAYLMAHATEILARTAFTRIRNIYAGHGYVLRENDMLKGLNDYCTFVKRATFYFERYIEQEITAAVWGAAEEQDKGKGSEMYDDFLLAANDIIRLVMMYIDRCAEGDTAASGKVYGTLAGLPSKGIFGDGDIRRYTLK